MRQLTQIVSTPAATFAVLVFAAHLEVQGDACFSVWPLPCLRNETRRVVSCRHGSARVLQLISELLES